MHNQAEESQNSGQVSSENKQMNLSINKEREAVDQGMSSVVDHIIKKWFPIIGVLFVVGGLSYLFYDGLWKNIDEVGRLALGFIFGVLFITGGYAFDNKLRGFADVIIGGGVLILYITLIFGSRFQGAETAIIPEVLAVVIAFIFSIAIAFYAYTRRSKHILLLGAIGGYLTPFFVGRAGEFKQYLADGSFFQYDISLLAYLIYFAAIGFSVFLVANKMFLKGVGLLNSIGLFVGTFSLAVFRGGELSENAVYLAFFSMIVVIFHIATMAVNAKRFEKETDPYLVGGYILPLVWFVFMMTVFIDETFPMVINSGMFAVVSAVYFTTWYYLRNITNSDRHFTLYIGGLASLIIGITYAIPSLKEYSGIFLTIISLVFLGLYAVKPLVSREAAMLLFAFAGVSFNLFQLGNIDFTFLGVLSGDTIFTIFTLIPFVLMSPTFGLVKDEGETIILRRITGYFAFVIIVFLLLIDIFDWNKIPMEFLFLTLPALILVFLGWKEKQHISKVKFFDSAVVVAAFGFISSFAVILGRMAPTADNTRSLFSKQSLIGLVTLFIFFVAIQGYKQLSSSATIKKVPFFVTFLFYLTLWSVGTHELLGVLNILDLDFSNPAIQGLRAFAVTIWWAGLALWMLFSSNLSGKFRDKRNIGFSLLAATIVKLIMYDLGNVNINLKVFLFIIIGVAILAVSYYENKKEVR